MKIHATPLDGVRVVELDRRLDSRGAFMRLFCEQDFASVLEGRHIVQVNHSFTSQLGAVRGMHFQYAPHAEMKLIVSLHGAVWDVVVDLRPDSSTYLKWHGVDLAAENSMMMVIPEGCAHGFQVQASDSELIYFHTSAYAPEAEGGVRYDDPTLGIQWPLPVGEVSARDRTFSLIDKNFTGVVL